MKKVSFLLAILLVSSNHELYARKVQLNAEQDSKNIKPIILPCKKPFVYEGASFFIKNMEIFLTNSQSFSAEGMPRMPVLAIRYRLVNNNPTKKINLDEPLKFMLSDEFQNQYRSVPSPSDYVEPLAKYPSSFPSLYPGEKFEEVIFFEAPISESRALFLRVNADNLGMENDFIVKIPTQRIEHIEKVALVKNPKPKKVDIPIGPIKITSPENGLTVAPGEFIHIQVKIPEHTKKPDRLFVIIPAYVLEDHQMAFEYDIKIPENEKGNFAITVVGKWDTAKGEEVLSDSIVLNIGPANKIN